MSTADQADRWLRAGAPRLAAPDDLREEVAQLRVERATLVLRLARALEGERAALARNRQRDWWAGCVMLARMLIGRDTR